MKTTITILVVVVLAVAAYYVFRPHSAVAPEYTPTPTASSYLTPTATPRPTATKTPTPSPTAGLGIQQVVIHRVSIQNFSFNPATTTVKKGDLVAFMNNDQVQHTVTSDTGAFTGGSVAPGTELTVSTDNLAPGTYPFHCSIHTTMHGTIVVQ